MYKHGDYPHGDDCTKYIECEFGELKTVRDCPSGKYFHPLDRECTTPDNLPDYCGINP